MKFKSEFLADFHIHSTFSDGKLTIPHIIDLYGQQGFGAIAITDHIAEKNTFIGKAAVILNQVLTESMFPIYQALLESEKVRAWEQYGMVVLTGYELSKNTVTNSHSAHIVGIGVTEWMSADGDALDLIAKLHQQGAVAIAAHPVNSGKLEKQTYYLWDRRRELAQHFDAWEVASGAKVFEEVKTSGLPMIASSDLHLTRHFESWKTVLRCEKHPLAILDAIRKQEIDFTYFIPKPLPESRQAMLA